MANMPGRNGVASSIHYPLPQPASMLFSQADKQQFTWNFIGPLAGTILRRIAIFGTWRLRPVIGIGMVRLNQRDEA